MTILSAVYDEAYIPTEKAMISTKDSDTSANLIIRFHKSKIIRKMGTDYYH